MFPEGRLLDFVLVGVVALIVVGPKDLPILMRRAGQFMAKVRGMANEFRASFDELARQSELDELRKEVNALRTGRPMDLAASAAKHAGVGEVFGDIQSDLGDTHTAMTGLMTGRPVPLPKAELVTPPVAETPPEPPAPEPTAPKPKRVRKPKAPAP